jgi:hypothetical protein
MRLSPPDPPAASLDPGCLIQRPGRRHLRNNRLLAAAVAMSTVVVNVVATLVIAEWEGGFAVARFDAYLDSTQRPGAPSLIIQELPS